VGAVSSARQARGSFAQRAVRSASRKKGTASKRAKRHFSPELSPDYELLTQSKRQRVSQSDSEAPSDNSGSEDMDLVNDKPSSAEEEDEYDFNADDAPLDSQPAASDPGHGRTGGSSVAKRSSPADDFNKHFAGRWLVRNAQTNHRIGGVVVSAASCCYHPRVLINGKWTEGTESKFIVHGTGSEGSPYKLAEGPAPATLIQKQVLESSLRTLLWQEDNGEKYLWTELKT